MQYNNNCWYCMQYNIVQNETSETMLLHQVVIKNYLQNWSKFKLQKQFCWGHCCCLLGGGSHRTARTCPASAQVQADLESSQACSDQCWQDKFRFSIWIFFELSTFVNSHLLCFSVCYWPTIHNYILKICPKFQVISSHFFKVLELLDKHWAKNWAK